MLFFDGRLLVSPAVVSRVDDSAMFATRPGSGNVLAVVGASDGGQPKTPLAFGSPSEAAAVLRGGELLDAVVRGFAGSTELPGPSRVVAVRVQPATRSTLALLSPSAQPVISLHSEQWGALANRVQVSVMPGTARGRRLRTRLDGAVHEADNVGRLLLSIRYTGGASTAEVNVTASAVTLAAPAGSVVATISFAQAPTAADLAERIALVPDWTATVLDGNGAQPSATLDFVAGGNARGVELALAADLQACVDWFNSAADPTVAAERVPGAGVLPAPIAGAYLSGAQTGVATMQDWADALTALQAADVQWVVPATADPAVHAAVSAHVRFCSDQLRLERRAVVGTALNTTDAAALLAARNLNTDRVGLIHIGIRDFDTAGRLRLFGPHIAAAMVAGGFAGANPGTALTNKALGVQGLERALRNPTDTDALIMGGVIPLEATPTGFRVVKSVSTWLSNANFNRRELSVGAALDFVSRTVRENLRPLLGGRQSPMQLAQAISRTRSALELLSQPEPQGPGTLVGDRENPPFRDIRVSIDGDALRVEFECSPVLPTNFIPVSIFAVPYSGTARAA